MESAAEFLRDLSEAMGDGVVESSPTTIRILAQIANDLDAIYGPVTSESSHDKTVEAIRRLRGVS